MDLWVLIAAVAAPLTPAVIVVRPSVPLQRRVRLDRCACSTASLLRKTMTAACAQVCCNYGLCGRCKRQRGAWRSSPPVAIQHASSEDCFLCHSPGATTVTWMRVACTDDKLFRDRCLFRRVDGGGFCVERPQENGEVQEAFLRIVGI